MGSESRLKSRESKPFSLPRGVLSRGLKSRDYGRRTVTPEAYPAVGGPRFASPAHFFAVAAEATRHVLVGSARRKAAQHGGGLTCHGPGELPQADPEPPDDPDQAELVKLRYFVTMTVEQAADALGSSPASAERRWGFCRAWLSQVIRGAAGTRGGCPGPDS